MSNPKKELPGDLYIDEKWDRFIDVTLRRVVYGTLAGSLAALVLFRGPCVRAASITFGSGFGAGSAWQACAKDFEGSVKKPSSS